MKKIVFAVLFFLFCAKPVIAAPPHLVINFASMNELDWAAPEDKWQAEVKPKIESQIRSMRTALTPNPQPLTPLLSWSTLMEYMNFPMDTPSENSIYAVKMRRILEIAEELDFPVYVPLNGFQWWDQLPELYNWWDEDGTHTDPKFFARQKNPEEFKARFIAGYDPDNQLNVEWQSPRTPMKLGYRNWGGGGFRLAPPPNLLSTKFQDLQRARLRVILNEITKKNAEWENESKEYLFVGVSIGTEISLNASVTPSDEFKPYGYGAIANFKVQNLPTGQAGPNSKSMTNDQLRGEALRQYLETTSQFVNRSGIPKEHIYTHVYGEADPKDPHYAPYAESAFNLYSLPGSSFYGFKDDPLASPQWKSMLTKYGNPDWGAIEYSDTPNATGLARTLSSARLVDIYNWDSVQSNKTSIQAIKSALSTTVSMTPCSMVHAPILHLQSGITARLGAPEVSTSSALPHGIYVKFTESDCGNGKKRYSQPEILYVPLPEVPDTTPGWVKWFLANFG